jgi:hypothetical protein
MSRIFYSLQSTLHFITDLQYIIRDSTPIGHIYRLSLLEVKACLLQSDLFILANSLGGSSNRLTNMNRLKAFNHRQRVKFDNDVIAANAEKEMVLAAAKR